jgi:hypothetical protein
VDDSAGNCVRCVGPLGMKHGYALKFKVLHCCLGGLCTGLPTVRMVWLV